MFLLKDVRTIKQGLATWNSPRCATKHWRGSKGCPLTRLLVVHYVPMCGCVWQLFVPLQLPVLRLGRTAAHPQVTFTLIISITRLLVLLVLLLFILSVFILDTLTDINTQAALSIALLEFTHFSI